MGFKRQVLPRQVPTAADLTAQMVGLGFRLTGKATRDANIEDVLLFASIEGMERDQLRTASLLTTWLAVHSPIVNADRLIALVSEQGSARVRAYWSSFGSFLE